MSGRPFTGVVDDERQRREAQRLSDALEAWFNEGTKPPATPDPIYPDEWRGHWVYLVASPADLVKVGISRTPDARLASLQSGHHDTLHRVLAPYRARGEWFRIGPWLNAFMEGAHAGENAGLIMKRIEALSP